MGVILQRKVANYNEMKAQLRARYLSLRDRIREADNDEEILETYYDLLLELDEILYQAHYAKSKLEISKTALTETEQNLLKQLDKYETQLERNIPIPDLIAEAPDLAIIRRQLHENSVEAGKIDYQLELVNANKKRRVEDDSTVDKKKTRAAAPTLSWLDSAQWSKEHVRCLFEGSTGKRTTTEKTTGVQELFKGRLGVNISAKTVFYLFLHYGIRDLIVESSQLNNAFDNAYLMYNHITPGRRFETIRTYIKDATNFVISKSDTSNGIKFRDILMKIYGEVKEPESNYNEFIPSSLSANKASKNSSKSDERNSSTLNSDIGSPIKTATRKLRSPNKKLGESKKSDKGIIDTPNNSKTSKLNAPSNRTSKSVSEFNNYNSPKLEAQSTTEQTVRENVIVQKKKITLTKASSSEYIQEQKCLPKLDYEQSLYGQPQQRPTNGSSVNSHIPTNSSNLKRQPLSGAKHRTGKQLLNTQQTNLSPSAKEIPGNSSKELHDTNPTQLKSNILPSEEQNLKHRKDSEATEFKFPLATFTNDEQLRNNQIESHIRACYNNSRSKSNIIEAIQNVILKEENMILNHDEIHLKLQEMGLGLVTSSKMDLAKTKRKTDKLEENALSSTDGATYEVPLLSDYKDKKQQAVQLKKEYGKLVIPDGGAEKDPSTIEKGNVNKGSPKGNFTTSISSSASKERLSSLDVCSKCGVNISEQTSKISSSTCINCYNQLKVKNPKSTRKIVRSHNAESKTCNMLLSPDSSTLAGLCSWTPALDAHLTNGLHATIGMPNRFAIISEYIKSEAGIAIPSGHIIERVRYLGFEQEGNSNISLADRKIHRSSLNSKVQSNELQNNIFDDLIYQIAISSKPDEYYKNKFENLNNSSYWTFELNKILTTTIEFLSQDQPTLSKATLELGRLNIVNIIIFRILRNHNMNVKSEIIKNRLITMMEHDVFIIKACELINKYLR